jgi:hypothetical protein
LTATTNNVGVYHFENLAPGSYLVTARAKGFVKKTVEVNLSTNENESLNLTLQVGQDTMTSITVSAEQASTLSTDDVRLQSTLSGKEVAELPVQGRDIYTLLGTAPGVTGYSSVTASNAFEDETTTDASANGQYSQGNTYTVDGINVSSNITAGTSNLTPNQDAVQEISIQTNSFSVTEGSGSSIQVAVTTKNGTNKFHGTGNMYYNDQHLQALSRWDKTPSPFQYKNLAGTLGGPIIKDKTFFFAQVESLFSTTTNEGRFIVEDPAIATWAKATAPNSIGAMLLNTYPAVNLRIVPGTAQSAASLFPANNTNGPACGTASSNFLPCNINYVDTASYAASPYYNGLQYGLRVDQVFRGGLDRVYANYTNSQVHQQSIDPRNFNQIADRPSWFLDVNYLHAFSTNLMNQASFIHTKVAGAEGLSGIWDIPGIKFAPQIGGNFVDGNIESFNDDMWNDYAPGNFWQHHYRYKDSVTWDRGRHSVRAGFEGGYETDQLNFGGNSARPEFIFQFLFDLPLDQGNPACGVCGGVNGVWDENHYNLNPVTGQYKPLTASMATTTAEAYIQDEYKITRTLTLTAGLRFEDYGNPHGTNGFQATNIYPATNAGLTQDEQIAGATVKVVNNPFNHSLKYVNPRIGLGWQPRFLPNTVIHAGGGVYNTPVTLGQVEDQIRSNPGPNGNLQGNVWLTDGGAMPNYMIGAQNNTAPYGFVYPKLTNSFNSSGGILGQNVNAWGLSPNLKVPKFINFMLGADHDFGRSAVVGITYNGGYGYDQLSATDFNRALGVQELNPNFGPLWIVTNNDHVNYSSLVVTIKQHLGSKLNYQANYSLGHTTDCGAAGLRANYGGGDWIPDPDNFCRYHGTASWDIREHFAGTASYALPSLSNNKILKQAVGGWQISTSTTIQSGTPFWVKANWFNNMGWSANDNTAIPNLPANNSQYLGQKSRSTYLNGVFGSNQGAAYQLFFTGSNPNGSYDGKMPYGVWGTEGRNIYRNPGLVEIDGALMKRFELPWFGSEKSNLRVRGEFFNLLNVTNLTAVDPIANNSDFGQSTSQFQPRTIQISARFEF